MNMMMMIMTGWITEENEVDSRQGLKIFRSSEAYRPAVGPTQRAEKRVTNFLSPGEKP
jgi:hypothetical protein